MGLITHRAEWVMIDPWNIVKNGFIQFDSGTIVASGQGRGENGIGHLVDHGPGVLMPPMVNAHTHLELTALKDKALFDNGFIPWVKSIIEKRDGIGSDKLLAAAADGLKTLLENGTLFVVEIASLGITKQLFLDSPVKGIWFKEYIGQENSISDCKCVSPAKSISIAGHAPHTTGPSLLVQLKKESLRHHLPFSLHLAESEDEVQFLSKRKGPWADFLSLRGIDFSDWDFLAESPVQYADHLGILDESTIAVHLIHVSKNDIDLVARKNVGVCLCPRSNMKLHGMLPDLPEMLKRKIRPCLGTDSLASNDSLNMFDEMAFTARSFQDISPADVLAMATINGLRALGINRRTRGLVPGAIASVIHVPVYASNRTSLLEKLVYRDFGGKITSILDNDKKLKLK